MRTLRSISGTNMPATIVGLSLCKGCDRSVARLPMISNGDARPRRNRVVVSFAPLRAVRPERGRLKQAASHLSQDATGSHRSNRVSRANNSSDDNAPAQIAAVLGRIVTFDDIAGCRFTVNAPTDPRPTTVRHDRLRIHAAAAAPSEGLVRSRLCLLPSIPRKKSPRLLKSVSNSCATGRMRGRFCPKSTAPPWHRASRERERESNGASVIIAMWRRHRSTRARRSGMTRSLSSRLAESDVP